MCECVYVCVCVCVSGERCGSVDSSPLLSDSVAGSPAPSYVNSSLTAGASNADGFLVNSKAGADEVALQAEAAENDISEPARAARRYSDTHTHTQTHTHTHNERCTGQLGMGSTAHAGEELCWPPATDRSCAVCVVRCVSLMAYRASLGELCATFVLVYTACGSGIAVNQRMAGMVADAAQMTAQDRQFGALASLSGQRALHT